MKNRKRFLILVLFLLCFFWGQPVYGIPLVGEWSPPIPISADLMGPSQFPKIVADSSGQLHVVWSENSYAVRNEADAIFYSSYDGINWSPPVDVLVPPDLQTARLGELAMLPDDTLALLWIGADTLQFSQVLAKSASQPSAWQTEALFGGVAVTNAFMAFVAPTTLYIAYIDSSTMGLMFAISDDLGTSWLGPTAAWMPASNDFAAEDVRLCRDNTGRILHLIWHENAREFNWNPGGVWYMRSLDQGRLWSDATFLPNRGSSPNCAYDGAGMLHMLWNNAVGSIDGRYHRFSTDDGATWTEPTVIFPGLSGRTRAPAMAVDGDGTLYVLNGAYAAGKTQMFASYWQNGSWAQPLSISGNLVSNESPDMVVTGGNRLNAVWHFGYEDTSFVWFSARETEAAPVAFDSPEVTAESPLVTSEPATSEVRQTPPLTTDESELPGLNTFNAPPLEQEGTSLRPLIWAIIAGALLTGGVVGVALSRRRR